jgi:rRNA-processing protein FCF1
MEFTPAEQDYLKEQIDLLPDGAVLAGAERYAEIRAGGFRLEKRHVALFRDRLKKKVKATLPPEMAALLRMDSLGQSLLDVLSVKALEYAQDELLNYYGSLVLRVYLKLDDREEARSLAGRLPEDAAPASGADRIAAANALIAMFDPFMGHVMDWLNEANPDDEEEAGEGAEGVIADTLAGGAAAEAAAEADKLKRKLERLTRELETARETAKRRQEQLNEARRAHREEARNLKNELAAKTAEARKAGARAQQEREESAARIAALENQLREQQEKLEAEVVRRFEKALEEEQNRWMARPRRLERLNRDKISAEDLKGRVEAALEYQARFDRQYGTVRQLVEYRDELLGLKKQLELARQNAREVHPDVAGLLGEINRQLETLRGDLPAPAAGEGDVSAYVAAIGNARTAEGLDELFRHIERSAEYKIIGPHTLDRLEKAYEERTGTLRAPRHRGAPPAEAVAKAVAAAPAPRESFLAHFDRGEPVFVLVDGHNALHNMARFGAEVHGGKPAAAREALARCFQRLVPEAKSGEIRIYFDSPQPNDVAYNKVIRLIYSGGKGANRADHRIISYLQHVKSESSAVPCYVISNDQEIARDARTAGAVVVSLEVLERLVNREIGEI